MFNVRVKRFHDTEQIQIFSKPLLSSGSEREDKRDVILFTGEIVPSNRIKFYNPFDEQEEIGCNMGNAEENLKRSCRRSKNVIYDLVRCNIWEWFITLTFNPEKVDSYDYEAVVKKLSFWLKNMRKICPDMKYVVVPEMHKSGRWHFHGLFSNVDNLQFVDSGKKDKKGRVVYNVGTYRLGWTTATRVTDTHKASSYISKYINKDLCNVTKGKKRYWNSKNCEFPEVLDYMVESPEQLKSVVEDKASYVKSVEGYVGVKYYEVPIYTTNFLTLSQDD